MKKISSIVLGSIGLVLLTGAVIIGCKKENTLVIAPAQAHFTGARNQSYTMSLATTPAYKVTVGTTDVQASDRTVNFKVSSPTGAVAGTHYTLSGVKGSSITIPAGQATADIVVQGAFASYAAGRKDTLMFVLDASPGVDVAKFQDTVKLYMRGPCFDGEIVFSQMLGTYTKTFENGSYGPYTSTVINATSTGPTTATATITNIYDSGISALATFNFTTVGSFTITVAPQQVGTLSGQPLFIRTNATGSFTYCTNFLRIPFELYTAAGTYDAWITTIAR